MKIISSIQANVPNRYLRKIRYKLYRLQEKYNILIYSKLHIKSEGSRRKHYHLKVILGVPGQDIVINTKGESMDLIIDKNFQNAKRQLAEMNKRLSA